MRGVIDQQHTADAEVFVLSADPLTAIAVRRSRVPLTLRLTVTDAARDLWADFRVHDGNPAQQSTRSESQS